MNLNFSNKNYYQKAINIMNMKTINNKLANEDAFFLLIQNVPQYDLNYLCEIISKQYNISLNNAYKLLQNNNDIVFKKEVLKTAIDIVKNKKILGNNYSDGFNTSSWINHCVLAAIVSYNLALILQINEKYAFNYGLLHDYGRKYQHDFSHVIIGFEKLSELGLFEAKGCLTHSFLNGNRYCCMQPVDNSFYLDSNGNEHINIKLDDMAIVLNNSKYDNYDYIVNIADLMATSSDIISPKERVEDILTRRPNYTNSPNFPYFLATLCNMLIEVMKKIDENFSYHNIDIRSNDLDYIKKEFEKISNLFYNTYNIKIHKKEKR